MEFIVFFIHLQCKIKTKDSEEVALFCYRSVYKYIKSPYLCAAKRRSFLLCRQVSRPEDIEWRTLSQGQPHLRSQDLSVWDHTGSGESKKREESSGRSDRSRPILQKQNHRLIVCRCQATGYYPSRRHHGGAQRMDLGPDKIQAVCFRIQRHLCESFSPGRRKFKNRQRKSVEVNFSTFFSYLNVLNGSFRRFSSVISFRWKTNRENRISGFPLSCSVYPTSVCQFWHHPSNPDASRSFWYTFFRSV